MRRKIAGLLCLSMVVLTVLGCRGTQKTQAEVQETPEVTAQETAEVTEAPPEETPEETPEAKIVPPIDIDTTIPVEKGMRIAVVVKSKDSGYWNNMKKHMQEAVDYLNQSYGLFGNDAITMTFEGPGSEEDVTSQINIIDAVLAENPAVLCLAAIDVDSCEAQLETAAENGIPVIMFDSSVDSDLVRIYCGTNNVEAGSLAAKKLAEAIGGQGEVAIFAHESITQTSKDRVNGFCVTIEEQYPEVKLESVSYENKEETMANMIRSVLGTYTELGGIFCTNGTIAEAALKILEEDPERDVKLVGFDSGGAQLKAIEAGTEYGAVAQDTYIMAYETIRQAICAAASEDPAEEQDMIYIPHVWIDQDSLNFEENQNILYK